MKFIKRILFIVLVIAAIGAIIKGIAMVAEPDKQGFYYIGIGAAVLLITSFLRKKFLRHDSKQEKQTNKCPDCGASMRGAQYRYFWNSHYFDIYASDNEMTYDKEGVSSSSMPVYVTATCPHCGAEKEFTICIKGPKLIDLAKPGYKKEDFARKQVQKEVEYFLNG